MKIKNIRFVESFQYTDKETGYKKTMLKFLVKYEGGLMKEVVMGEKDMYFAVKSKLDYKK